MTLAEARAQLMNDREDGVVCPCCDQFAKVYRRKINTTMARGLIDIYRNAGRDWCHVRELRSKARAGDNREESKLRYWALLEEEPDRRPDGGRSGWWRVTDWGEAFVLGRARVPKYAHIYNGDLLRLDHSQLVSISDALGFPFNYNELMVGI